MAPVSFSIQPSYRPPRAVPDELSQPEFSFLCAFGPLGCCGIRKQPKHPTLTSSAALDRIPILAADIAEATQPVRHGSGVRFSELPPREGQQPEEEVQQPLEPSEPSPEPGSSRSRETASFQQRRKSLKRGMTSFVESDPRRHICEFLKPGDSRGPAGYLRSKRLARRSRFQDPDDSHFFGVFRPTSREAINMMMTGRATGKGLTVKGKSARKGDLAGFVPFLQIAEEAHKAHVRMCAPTSRCRVYYRSDEAREAALEALRTAEAHMLRVSRAAKRSLEAYEEGSMPLSHETRREACVAMRRWFMGDLSSGGFDAAGASFGCSSSASPAGFRSSADSKAGSSNAGSSGGVDAGVGGAAEEAEEPSSLLELIDASADGSEAFGVEMPARLLWEVYVARQDISHAAGGFGETGRESEPGLMDLNVQAVTNQNVTPKAVLWQYDSKRPLNPRGLLMAHEEDKLRPVASDIDCLLLGSRHCSYQPIAAEQLEQIDWMLLRIDGVLSEVTPARRVVPPDPTPLTERAFTFASPSSLRLRHRLTASRYDSRRRQPKPDGWMHRWLDSMKVAALTTASDKLDTPRFGFGDPTSNAIVEEAVKALHATGAIRHGAECFNYHFPQVSRPPSTLDFCHGAQPLMAHAFGRHHRLHRRSLGRPASRAEAVERAHSLALSLTSCHLALLPHRSLTRNSSYAGKAFWRRPSTQRCRGSTSRARGFCTSSPRASTRASPCRSTPNGPCATKAGGHSTRRCSAAHRRAQRATRGCLRAAGCVSVWPPCTQATPEALCASRAASDTPPTTSCRPRWPSGS